jgi:hypothetical protein
LRPPPPSPIVSPQRATTEASAVLKGAAFEETLKRRRVMTFEQAVDYAPDGRCHQQLLDLPMVFLREKRLQRLRLCVVGTPLKGGGRATASRNPNVE